MVRAHLLVAVAALAGGACSRSNDDAARGTPGEHKPKATFSAPADRVPTAPWSFDPAALKAKLQGAWVVKDHPYLGATSAWEVSGDQVKVWDAKANKETIETMAIEAPCQLSLNHAVNGGHEGTTTHFVFDGDTLHMGLGDAGVKLGDQIVGCMSNGVFVQSGGACQFYLPDFAEPGRWEAGAAATCSLTGDTFKASNKTFNYDGSMTVHGAVLADDQLWRTTPVKVGSYDEAKAKAAAK